MHFFILGIVLLMLALANVAIGVFFAASIEQHFAAAKLAEQGEAVKIISVVNTLKAFWAKIPKAL